MTGYITFRLAARELACRLDEVREVVRLAGLESLPGMTPPVSGVLELRGSPLPVIDLRLGGQSERGDVLVLEAGADTVGVVVDQVTAVLDEDDLVASSEEVPTGLPHYVVQVLRRDAGAPVLLVDLRRLVAVAA